MNFGNRGKLIMLKKRLLFLLFLFPLNSYSTDLYKGCTDATSSLTEKENINWITKLHCLGGKIASTIYFSEVKLTKNNNCVFIRSFNSKHNDKTKFNMISKSHSGICSDPILDNYFYINDVKHEDKEILYNAVLQVIQLIKKGDEGILSSISIWDSLFQDDYSLFENTLTKTDLNSDISIVFLINGHRERDKFILALKINESVWTFDFHLDETENSAIITSLSSVIS